MKKKGDKIMVILFPDLTLRNRVLHFKYIN